MYAIGSSTMSLNYLDAAIKLEDENKLPGIMVKEYGVDYFFQWGFAVGSKTGYTCGESGPRILRHKDPSFKSK